MEESRRGKNRPQAQEIALRLLTRRDHSIKELRQKLLTRNIPPAEAEAVLLDLSARGLLDDARYARKLAFHLSAEKLLGPRRIREKMTLKGIPPDLFAEAEREAEREFPPGERLRRLVRTRLQQRTVKELTPPEQIKLGRFLYQRGFPWSDIQELFYRAGGWFEE